MLPGSFVNGHPPSMQIRSETPADWVAVRAVHLAAFETPAEADLVERLRGRSFPYLSLVADDKGLIVGHAMFTPMLLPGHPRARLLGLAPLAVLPDRQRCGVGAALLEAGLMQARDIGAGAVLVLGHPDYYPRFGFEPASRHAIDCEYVKSGDAPEAAFMVIELVPGHLDGLAGTAQYHAAFAEL